MGKWEIEPLEAFSYIGLSGSLAVTMSKAAAVVQVNHHLGAVCVLVDSVLRSPVLLALIKEVKSGLALVTMDRWLLQKVALRGSSSKKREHKFVAEATGESTSVRLILQ